MRKVGMVSFVIYLLYTLLGGGMAIYNYIAIQKYNSDGDGIGALALAVLFFLSLIVLGVGVLGLILLAIIMILLLISMVFLLSDSSRV